jgi:DNA-binding FadR family transcriptional regulator
LPAAAETISRIGADQLTEPVLTAVRDSVQRAARLPARPGWERKATAHAEIFRLLADAAGTPVVLTAEAGRVRDLMITVGPAADGLITNSRRRLLACLHAGDPDGAADEMEDHLRVLHFMARLAGRPGDDLRGTQ